MLERVYVKKKSIVEKDKAAYKPSNNQELYTPEPYIEAVRAVLGGIDLDPASSARANTIVKATHFFTRKDNGLTRPWTKPDGSAALVFDNPPYGKFVDDEGKERFNTVAWTDKFIHEHEQQHMIDGIMLVNAQAGTNWFHKMTARYSVCLVKGRIKFIDGATMKPLEQPRWYSAFFYTGHDIRLFHRHFQQFGSVMINYRNSRFT